MRTAVTLMRSAKMLVRSVMSWLSKFARHSDPLAEAGNWAALAIGTHLPFWPLYLWWAAGSQIWPSGLLTVGLTPVFLLIPLVSRRSSLGGRIAMLLAGLANTVFTLWVLGQNTGTALFFIPCAVLAAVLFRHSERWLMLFFALLPLALWYGLLSILKISAHHYDPVAANKIFELNAFSIAVLIALFGWIQAKIYRRMEQSAR